MTICYRCKQDKEPDEFNWLNKKQGKRQPFCRECSKVYRRNWYQNHKQEQIARTVKVRERTLVETREYVVNYLKTHPCALCGMDDIRVLEFDHVRGEKRKNISSLISGGYSVRIIAEEISKCQVLCANCHRRKTSEDQGWFKSA